ncbi:MAG: AAA family ATPase [Planctomycetota bacterium]
MIVRSLRAEGFMRYERIEVADLPEGVIALTGDNEAGKTTLGEAVAFALFGRTIRTEDTDPTQAINWDVDVCRTEIQVEVPNPDGGRRELRVERLVARTGEVEARLYVGDELLAEGPRQVNEALVRLIGFDFPTFRYSFYVAQGELDLVQREGRDNARRIIYDMLGISTIERAKGLLEDEARELRERSNTLERDLIVASALHTDALPLKDELHRYEEALHQAQALLEDAQQEVDHAQTMARFAEEGLVAQRERSAALGGLERALVADTQRRNLLRARARLNALADGVAAQVRQAEGALSMDASARQKARTDLERAEAVDREARRLAALVGHRGEQLAAVTADAAPDGVPARQRRERAVVEREGRSITLATVIAAVCGLLFLLGAGGAAGMHLPPDQPFLAGKLPQDGVLQSPRLGLRVEHMSPKRASIAFGGVGALGLALLVVGLVLRAKASGRREEAQAELGRLEELLGAERGEQAICAGFQVPALAELAAKLRGVSDPQVKSAREALERAAGDWMQRQETPAAILSAARQRFEDVETSQREAEPRLREARRVAAAAEAAGHGLDVALEQAFPGGAPAPGNVQGDEVPAELEGLAAAIEEAAGAATRARIELEAALAGGEERAVAECIRALRDALARGLAAAGPEAGGLRARYDEQTGLPELLKDREVLPSSESLRAVLKRERELLDELFGDEGAARAAARAAEDELRHARQRRGEAQAAVDDAVARGERAEAGRRKLVELERKMQQLRSVLEPTLRKVRVQEEAADLMGDLVEVMKARFGPGIARYVEIVLPRLTDGRYTRVKLGPDLDIRIYSRDRGDYVRLVELSLGTADQILVALRLGLARALAHSRGLPGGHFLFLDEPLVSADEGREQAFLNLLRTFDDEFAQIFVSSPRELPPDGPFSGYVRVSRQEAVLRYEAGTPA